MIKAIVLLALAAVATAQVPNLAVPGGDFQYHAEQRILAQQYAQSQPILPSVPGLAAHQAAEAAVLASQGLVPGLIVHNGNTARVQQAEADLIALQAQQVRKMNQTLP